ncbi:MULTISPECIES: ABC transporter substrate-binding protein [unclassified Nonomuraea]|uniref:ABC transporter substrate-binding protein n=1 Tax=unclassified Nonomuraea TaxID=2593643 RepID=UPI0033C4A4FB
MPGLTQEGDPAAARRSLAACGRPGGFGTAYAYRDRPSERALAEAVQAALAQVGIKLTLKPYPPADFLREYGSSPAYLKKEGIGLVARSWSADWPDSGSFLSELADGKAIRAEFSVNLGIAVPEIDALVAAGRKETDPVRRQDLWDSVEAKVVDQSLLVPIAWQRTLLLRGKRLAGAHVGPAFGGYDLVTLGLA